MNAGQYILAGADIYITFLKNFFLKLSYRW